MYVLILVIVMRRGKNHFKKAIWMIHLLKSSWVIQIVYFLCFYFPFSLCLFHFYDTFDKKSTFPPFCMITLLIVPSDLNFSEVPKSQIFNGGIQIKEGIVRHLDNQNDSYTTEQLGVQL